MDEFRVYLFGQSMTACYDVCIDVCAVDTKDAKDKAKRKLTSKNGAFYNWSPNMFKVTKIELR